jgi:hypothetical protein
MARLPNMGAAKFLARPVGFRATPLLARAAARNVKLGLSPLGADYDLGVRPRAAAASLARMAIAIILFGGRGLAMFTIDAAAVSAQASQVSFSRPPSVGTWLRMKVFQ